MFLLLGFATSRLRVEYISISFVGLPDEPDFNLVLSNSAAMDHHMLDEDSPEFGQFL